jgi:hypothetical protein
MKSITAILLLLVITGCSTAPRLDQDSGADYAITISESSSSALIALSKTSITGVRDLSRDEFDNVKKAVERFETPNTTIEDTEKRSNSKTSAGLSVGTSFGLGSNLMSGISVFQKLGDDDIPRNFDFANDFSSQALIYSPKGSEELIDELVSVIPNALMSFNKHVDSVLHIGMDDEILNVVRKAGVTYQEGDAPTTSHTYKAIGSADGDKNGKIISSKFYYSLICDPNSTENTVCELSLIFTIDENNHPLISLLAKEVSQVMPEGSLMYLPPRKDLNRIPMVYNSDGEVMYLVEKE